MASKYDHLRISVPLRLNPGEAFSATKGEDFFCEPESFQGAVYKAAKDFGFGYKATCVVIGRVVIYAFYQGADYMRPNLPAYPIVKKLKGEL